MLCRCILTMREQTMAYIFRAAFLGKYRVGQLHELKTRPRLPKSEPKDYIAEGEGVFIFWISSTEWVICKQIWCRYGAISRSFALLCARFSANSCYSR